MKNNLKKMFSDALVQPLESIAADAWEPQTEAENENQFNEFLSLLECDIANGTRSENCAAYRHGRRMIQKHLKP